MLFSFFFGIEFPNLVAHAFTAHDFVT